MKLSRRHLYQRLDNFTSSFITHGRLKSVFIILLLIMGVQSPPPATAFFDRVKHIKSELYDLNKSCGYYGNDKKELEICLKERAAAGDNEESLKADIKALQEKARPLYEYLKDPENFGIAERMIRSPEWEKLQKARPGGEMDREISMVGSNDRRLNNHEDLDKALSRLKPCLDECDWLNESFSGTYDAIPSEGILKIFDDRMAIAKKCFEEYTNVFQLQVGQHLVNCKNRLEASNNYRKMREEAITALNAVIAFLEEESKKKPIEITLVSYIDKVIVKNNSKTDMILVITEYIDNEFIRTFDTTQPVEKISEAPPAWRFTPAEWPDVKSPADQKSPSVPRTDRAGIHTYKITVTDKDKKLKAEKSVDFFVEEKVLNVARVRQEGSLWCWAAGGQAILNYLGRAVYACDLVNIARRAQLWPWSKPAVDCCAEGPAGEGCDFGLGATSLLSSQNTYSVLKEEGFWAVVSEEPLGPQAVYFSVNIGYPFMMGIKNHFVVARGYRRIYDGTAKSDKYRTYLHIMDPQIYPHYVITEYNQMVKGRYLGQEGYNWVVSITNITSASKIQDKSGWIDLPEAAIVNVPFEARLQGISDDSLEIEWFSPSTDLQKTLEAENGRTSEWTGTIPGTVQIGAKVFLDKQKKNILGEKSPKQVQILPPPKLDLRVKFQSVNELAINLDSPEFGSPLPLQLRLLTSLADQPVPLDVEKINLLPDWHCVDDGGNEIKIKRDDDLRGSDIKKGQFAAIFEPPSSDRIYTVWAVLNAPGNRQLSTSKKIRIIYNNPLSVSKAEIKTKEHTIIKASVSPENQKRYRFRWEFHPDVSMDEKRSSAVEKIVTSDKKGKQWAKLHIDAPTDKREIAVFEIFWEVKEDSTANGAEPTTVSPEKKSGLIITPSKNEVMATDIFEASAQVPTDISGQAREYNWSGPSLLNPDKKGGWATKSPQATLQFQPMTGRSVDNFDPNQKIFLTMNDATGKVIAKGEVPIKLKPVGFSASTSWEVTPVKNGFDLKRKEAMKTSACGDKTCSAFVRAAMQLRWCESFCPENMDDSKKAVNSIHAGKIRGTYHGVTPGKEEEFTIGDFKGFIAHKPPQLYYTGTPEAVDLSFPSTISWIAGYFLKGRSVIYLNGDVYGGGERKGEGGKFWFDDTPFVDQHTKAAYNEMMAILKSISIGPDNKITQIPYKGPAFDGSDLPKVKLVYTQKGKLKMGDVVPVKAVVENAKPEDSPLQFEWSGDHEGKGDTVNFMAQKAGTSTLSVTVNGARFSIGSASANFEVEDLKAVIIKDEPTANSFPIGKKARFSAALTSGGQKVSGNYIYRWQPSTEVTFTPHEGTSAQTTGIFRRTGKTQVWVEVLLKKGDVLSTVARSENLELDIINPALNLSAVPDTPMVGQEVKVTVQEDPKMDDKTIDFWWEIAGNAANPGPLQNNRIYTYKPKDTKPVTVTVHAKGRDKGDDLGSQKITITARAYTVSISSPKYIGAKPRIWKCNTELGGECPGLVEVGDTQFAVHHNIFMKASLTPAIDRSALRYGWTISPDGCSGGGSISDEIRLNCSNPGTYTVKVEVTNTDGAKLGEAAQSVTISISEETLNNSKKAKEAFDKLQKAKELVAQGKLDEGIGLAEEASKLDPKNTEAADLTAKWKKEKETVLQYIDRMKKLAGEGKIPEAKDELSGAKNLHPKYQPVIDAENFLKAKIDEANEKIAKARKLRDEGEALQNQGKLEEAIQKYRESLKYVPDKALEDHIRTLEAKIADAKKKKSAADGLWGEGLALYNQNRFNDALTKFKESLKYWSDQSRLDYVQKMETAKASAKKLRDEGETLQNQKQYEEAINKYRASLKIWPDPKLEEHIKLIEAKIAEAKNKKQTADRLWNEGIGLYNQNNYTDALAKLKESLTHWSDQTRQDYVQKMEDAKASAKKLRDEGEAFQNQGKLQDAVNKYKQSVKTWSNPALEEHIAKVEDEIRRIEEKKACAKKNRDEGAALQQQNRLSEALDKFNASYACWPTPEMDKHIRDIQNYLAGQKTQATGHTTDTGQVSSQTPAAGTDTGLPATSGFKLGRIWKVKQWIGKETWTWVWTRQGDTDTFDALARNDQTGFESRHAIYFKSFENGKVTLSRPDAYGNYIGTVSADGKEVVSGIMDSITHNNQGWTAVIE